MSDSVNASARETLDVAFVPSAWRRSIRGFRGYALVTMLFYGWQWMRADEVARDYADFWGLDSPQLPFDYWLGPVAWFFLAVLIRLAARRLRRDPRLRIGGDHIEASFTLSFTRRIERARVTEVRFDAKRRMMRFEIPDGLVLEVDTDLLEFSPVAEDAVAFADLCARTLDVPLVRV